MVQTVLTLEQAGVDLAHHFSGGVYAKETRIPAGTMLVQHAHSFPHMSILAKGRVIVDMGEEDSQVFDSPVCIEIRRGLVHRVIAITDAVWFCIHATECTDPEKVDSEILP